MLVKDLNNIAVKNGTSIKRMRNAVNRMIESSNEYDLFRAGVNWYNNAYDECVDISLNSQYTIHQVAAAVAHLSPRMSWNLNIKYARELVETGSAPVMTRSLENAKIALDSDNPIDTFGLGAMKTRNFYHNILGDYSKVTVDSWAARIAIPNGPSDQILGRKGMYNAVSHAYTLAGKDQNLTPAETQAVAWCVARGTHE